MKGIAAALAVLAFAIAWALSPGQAHAQQPADPLVDPPQGGNGSRFQVVGQAAWTPGETVVLEVAFTAADPLAYAGPFPFRREVTVLRDGTWSFPIVVNDTLLGAPLGTTPGFLVVRAQSGARVAVNAYVYTVNGTRPSGAERFAPLGFGPLASPPTAVMTLALFMLATGGLIVACAATTRRRLAA